MINRNEVAREKMQRAAEMLQDNNIDMWVFYARLKTCLLYTSPSPRD